MRTAMTTQDVVLRAVFVNEENQLVNPDSAPELYLYDPSISLTDIQDEIDAVTYTGLGPFAATEISTGYWEYTYTVPAGATEGTWKDLWVSNRDGIVSHSVFNFNVVSSYEAVLQGFEENELIIITIDETVADVDGNTLGETLEVSFSTFLNPLYASVEMIRMEVGRWIDFIPDDTLLVLLHWSSKEADQITPKQYSRTESRGWWDGHVHFTSGPLVNGRNNVPGNYADMLDFARSKFVVYDAALRALRLPGAAEAANVTQAGQMKRLGDLMIQGPQAAGLGGSGLTQGMLNDIKKERDKWWKVVNSGGRLVPGESYDPAMGVRGFLEPDRRKTGRKIETPPANSVCPPTANSKRRIPGRRKHTFMYGD